MGQEDVIARRYARGLAEYAGDENRMDEVRRDVRLLADLLDPGAGDSYVPEFRDFLSSPVVSPADKLAAAGKILAEAGVGRETADFLSILIEHNRVELLPRVARAFADFSGEMTGELTAVVHTARPLSDDQARRLTEALSAAVGGQVRIHQQVEPALLAGARITVGDKTFDGTVLGRLERLRHHLVSEAREELAKETAGAAQESADKG